MKKKRVIVFDFDGTWTDVDAEAGPYRQAFLADVANMIGLPLPAAMIIATEIEAEIKANPDDHGWEHGGFIVAPAMADALQRTRAITGVLFDRHGMFPDRTGRGRLLDRLYREHYPKCHTVFQPNAPELMAATDVDATYVVTNSDTAQVRRKIARLGESSVCATVCQRLLDEDRIRGDARKYVIDPAWDLVPESLAIPGIKRPVLLRRRAYYEVLDAIRLAHDAEWEDLFVAGDIGELDLALPLALGAQVGLVANQYTRVNEYNFLYTHERGFPFNSLSETCQFLTQ